MTHRYRPNAAENPLRLIRLRPKTYVCLLDVLWVDGDGPYSIIRLKNGHHVKVSVPLRVMAGRLPELVRSSKSVLVNLAYVAVVPQHSNVLKLTTGERLPVARRRKALTRKLLRSYQSNSLPPTNAMQELTTSENPVPKPEIVPVGAVRLSPAEMPNRAQRNSLYTELGNLNFVDAKVRCYAHRQAGSLLFAFPDNSGFTLDTDVIGNQLYKYWKLTSVQPADSETGADQPDQPQLPTPDEKSNDYVNR